MRALAVPACCCSREVLRGGLRSKPGHQQPVLSGQQMAHVARTVVLRNTMFASQQERSRESSCAPGRPAGASSACTVLRVGRKRLWKRAAGCSTGRACMQPTLCDCVRVCLWMHAALPSGADCPPPAPHLPRQPVAAAVPLVLILCRCCATPAAAAAMVMVLRPFLTPGDGFLSCTHDYVPKASLPLAAHESVVIVGAPPAAADADAPPANQVGRGGMAHGRLPM